MGDDSSEIDGDADAVRRLCAEHRKSIGRTDDSPADSHTLPPANDDLVIDAEIVDDGDELIATMRSHARVESDDGLFGYAG